MSLADREQPDAPDRVSRMQAMLANETDARERAEAERDQARAERDDWKRKSHAEQARLSWLESDEAVERLAARIAVFSNRYRDPEGEQFEGSEGDYLLEMARVLRDALLEGELGAELRSRGRT